MDALGDPGRLRGGRPTYAVCTIWLPYSEQELEAIFAEMRATLGLRANFEFHARQLTSRHRDLPERFFAELLQRKVPLECWCAQVEKSRSRLPLHIAGKALTCELMAQTLERMPDERVTQVPLVIDEESTGKKVSKAVEDMRTGVKRALEDKGKPYTLGKISARPAHQKAGLQLADFLVAALVDPWPTCLHMINGASTWKITHWRT